MNALTNAGVLVEDKLFATLDTTTRRFILPNKQKILLIDTVGFIRKLPHQLIAAFKSTLEEAAYADVLLHVVDISHPLAYEQAEAALAVLKELEATELPMITVLNKRDLCSQRGMIDRLRAIYGKTVEISAKEGTGLDRLFERMMEELRSLRQEVQLCIPQHQYGLVSEIFSQSEVIYCEYEGNNVILRARVPIEILHKIEPFVIQEPVG
jgi:GTP-binding protein HflX